MYCNQAVHAQNNNCYLPRRLRIDFTLWKYDYKPLETQSCPNSRVPLRVCLCPSPHALLTGTVYVPPTKRGCLLHLAGSVQGKRAGRWSHAPGGRGKGSQRRCWGRGRGGKPGRPADSHILCGPPGRKACIFTLPARLDH